MGKHVGLARLAREIKVDMHLVVIAGCSGIEGEHGAIDRFKLQQSQLIAYMHIADFRGYFHQPFLSVERAMSGYQQCVRRPDW
ncbi:hypothetical protein D3C81_1782850 [compost metagenome]